MSYTCNICTRIFVSKIKYEKHCAYNRCKEPYKCEACNYIIKRKSDYEKHLKTKKCIQNTRESKKETVFICDGCNKTFRDYFNLDRHKKKKIPCTSLNMINNNQMTINNTINNNVYVNAHDPNAFIKNLNKVDKAIYNNVLGSYSINSPESIERLKKIAEETKFYPSRLMDSTKYPSDEEEEIEDINHEYRKQANSSFLSKIFCKAFLDFDELEYTPFFRVPNTKKLKVKHNNIFRELDIDIVCSLIDSFIHKMEVVKKEKNIDLYNVEKSIDQAYDEFRFNFIKLLKKYEVENKRINNKV